MPLFQLGLLLVLLPVCSFCPGFFFVRRLRWNPLEKLCGSIGLSLLLVYLAAWGIYCAGPRGDHQPVHPLPYAVVSIVCAALGLLCVRDILRLLRNPTVRRALAGFGFLAAWQAVTLAIIRVYTGGTWFNDWMEHFQRSLFFLQHFPADTKIMPIYVVPARPPMMNVLAAFFLAQTSDRFEFFQVVFVFLNLLVFLSCYLMLPALGKKARRHTWPLVLLFVASPVIMENISYTWTKSGAAFYIVLALWLYLAGWRKGSRSRIVAAFLALAAGLLAHYSAGPYIAILAVHYLVTVFPRRPNRWAELALIAVSCGLVLSAWFVWSVAVYGPHTTFASNTSVTSSQDYEGSNIAKIGLNLIDSIVPLHVRNPALLGKFADQRTAGYVRDWFFSLYQHNAIFSMGLIGGPLVLWLVYSALWRKRRTPPEETRARGKRAAPRTAPAMVKTTPEQRFWRVLLVAAFVMGIAVVGEQDLLGVAHLTLLSLQVLGVSMIAAVLPWHRRRALALVVLAGCVLDFSLGVMLQVHVESLVNTPDSTVFPNMVFTGTTIQAEPNGPDSLALNPWNNWFVKKQLSLFITWRREMDLRYGSLPSYQAMLGGYQESVAQAYKDDQANYQGWFARHGGQTDYVGDDVAAWFPAANGAAQVLLVILFAGLLTYVYRAEVRAG